MFAELPNTAADMLDWPWTRIEPFYQELASRSLTQPALPGWLADWTRLLSLLGETHNRLYVGITSDTASAEAEGHWQNYLDQIFPPSNEWNQKLKQKLLASGLQPPAGFEIPIRNMRTEAELFRQENLPLQSEELKLNAEYDKIVGAQTVEWEGRELTITQLKPINQDPDREQRERSWRLAAERQMRDRSELNELWIKLLDLRSRQAANANLPDYREYQWRNYQRYDYSPADCEHFHQAIEKVVVPAAEQLHAKRRTRLGVSSLRPWDLEVDPFGRPALVPFQDNEKLETRVEAIFQNVDPQLGDYFSIMRRENLLDLENRKNKAPGGYCTEYFAIKRPFIFMNAVGLHDDVQTLLHEGGHGFHLFESSRLPYFQQLKISMEIAEVASMGMELLAAPYLTQKFGGFYTPAEAARARIEHLEGSLLFWPYMAVVDSFQHWVYTHPLAARDPDECDRAWDELWARFMRGVDWSGLEQERMTGWQRKLHIFQVPFYYIEYGLAQLGAMQVWANALRDQAGAVAAYRRALAMGGTASLPKLYATAGARFAFDEATLQSAVNLAVSTIDELEKVTA